MAAAVPFAVGRDADVFSAGPGRVLRRYRDGRHVGREAEVMRYLHGQGYPVPAVVDFSGADLTMELVEGHTLAEQLLSGQLSQEAGGRLLWQLHRRLHALAPLDRARGSVLHLDLHPFNVLMSAAGPVVIDWSNTQTGDPADDVATTALILGQAATGMVAEVSIDVTPLLVAFLAHAAVSPLPALGRAVERRRRDPNTSAAELSAVDDAAGLVRASMP